MIRKDREGARHEALSRPIEVEAPDEGALGCRTPQQEEDDEPFYSEPKIEAWMVRVPQRKK